MEYKDSLIYYIQLLYTQKVIKLSLIIFIKDSLLPKLTIGIYIKMISSGHIINGVDLKSSNSKENIPRIGFGGVMISAPKIKYYQDIKGSDIKIHILSPIQKTAPNISGRDM